MRDPRSDLRPREFGVALIMAAGWYFLGPWGIVPTIWFLALIVTDRPPWLAASARLLPVAQRRALAAGAAQAQAHWRQLSAPWRADGGRGQGRPALAAPAWGDDDPLGGDDDAGDPAGLPSIRVDELAESDNLLIVGNRGSGKTTLLQAILAQRQRRCYVLDPHSHPGKWPRSTRVIGGGRDFTAIYAALLRAEGELTRRAQLLNTDAHARFAPLTLASDEWGSVTSEITVGREQDPPGRLMIRLLKEGRKFGLSFIGCAHGDTAASLGSKGDTLAFQASFDWIVYCGAFVAPQLKDLPDLVRQLPLGRTREGGTFPLVVVAVSPTTGARRLLDLRGIEPAPPVPVAADAEPPWAASTLDTQPLGRGAPAELGAAAARTVEPVERCVTAPIVPFIALDARTDAPIPAPPTLQSRADLVRLLVQAGWGVTQIRDVVKGTNAEIGTLVRQIEDDMLNGRS